MHGRGQAIVEFAIIVPFALVLILVMTEAGFLVIAKAAQDRATSVVAQWAADHSDESWHAVAERELKGCDVSVETPLPDLTEATATCQYNPVVFVGWTLLRMMSREAAAGTPSPSASPTPEGSASS